MDRFIICETCNRRIKPWERTATVEENGRWRHWHAGRCLPADLRKFIERYKR